MTDVVCYFFGFWLEGGIQLILFDARRQLPLIKILLFGAIAHHAGMANVSFLFGVRRDRRFYLSCEISERGCESLNALIGR